MKDLTDSELLVLGLVAEMPRHGYQLEQIIEERGMREWTQIGFSSIYFVLGKLEKRGLVLASQPATAKGRKSFRLTELGQDTLVEQTLGALGHFKPNYSSLLMGMIHWAVLSRDQALDALSRRKRAVAAEKERLAQIQLEQQPLPDFVDAMFEFSLGQLRAEEDWITQTWEYMRTKHWNEENEEEE